MSPSSESLPANCVAVLTPPGRAAIATVAVVGPRAMDVAAQCFRPAGNVSLTELPLGRIVYGQWISDDASSLGAVGEGVVLCRTAPQRVEVHCHGGKAAVAAIVAAFTTRGIPEVDWRSFLPALETNPLSAEARTALAAARTEQTAAILLEQYRGALRAAVEAVRRHLQNRQQEAARQEIDRLLARSSVGLHLASPWQVVLAGRPNVGKSSLINALIGYQRAIVHDMPGVTRDVVTAATALDGWPIELADTAGVRTSDDPLEAAGVTKTRQELERADVVVLVFDATQPWSVDDSALWAAARNAIVVYNKCDLAAPPADGRPPGLSISAVTGEGLHELKKAIVQRLAPEPPQPGEAVPFTERQVALLIAAQAHLNGGDIPAVLANLETLLAWPQDALP